MSGTAEKLNRRFSLESSERVPDNPFDQGDFFVPQRLEFMLTTVFRKRTVILANEHDEVLGETVRHFDRIHDSVNRLIVAAQIFDLARQILLDRPPDTRVQKLGLIGAVEIPVEVRRIVDDLYRA